MCWRLESAKLYLVGALFYTISWEKDKEKVRGKKETGLMAWCTSITNNPPFMTVEATQLKHLTVETTSHYCVMGIMFSIHISCGRCFNNDHHCLLR